MSDAESSLSSCESSNPELSADCDSDPLLVTFPDGSELDLELYFPKKELQKHSFPTTAEVLLLAARILAHPPTALSLVDNDPDSDTFAEPRAAFEPLFAQPPCGEENRLCGKRSSHPNSERETAILKEKQAREKVVRSLCGDGGFLNEEITTVYRAVFRQESSLAELMRAGRGESCSEQLSDLGMRWDQKNKKRVEMRSSDFLPKLCGTFLNAGGFGDRESGMFVYYWVWDLWMGLKDYTTVDGCYGGLQRRYYVVREEIGGKIVCKRRGERKN